MLNGIMRSEHEAEVCVAGFERSLVLILTGIGAMRDAGVPASEIARRVSAASMDLLLGVCEVAPVAARVL